MINGDKREVLEEEYGMPVERLMYHFYQEQGMSAGDIAAEISPLFDQSVHRNTVKYWLRQSGIEMRTRQLSDVQRVLMLAYFDAGLGAGAIAKRVGCGRMTVKRYREEIEAERQPADMDSWVSSDDYGLLIDIVDDTFGPVE